MSMLFPTLSKVTQLLDQHCVDEAIILAETVAAVDEVKDEDKAFKVLYNTVLNACSYIC